ncbi:beta strand repeat-containing protein, partial [Methylobacterium haplocladii]
GAGNHVILGDSGKAVFRNGRAQRIESITPDVGGADTIEAKDGNSRIIGGAGADTITTGAGNHVILGDSGEADFTVTVLDGVATSQLARIATTAPSVGGADTITFGAGTNVVLGGAAGDVIKGADKGAVILGDNGVVTFDALGRILRALSTDTAVGGDDTIEIGDGDNVVLGGYGRDGITIGNGSNVVLGDSGQADFEAGAIVEIASTSPEVGDRDTIKLGRGRNTVIAGAGGDSVTAGDGANVVLGDAGYARFTAAGLPIIVETTYDNVGGSDVITVGNGDSVILGGSGGDFITAGDGRAVVLGDNGQATFDALGRVVQAATTAATSGARDEITLGNGGSVVVGGVGADKIVTGSGSDVILGDNGSVVFLDGVLVSLETLESTFGGGDLILAGEGDNVVFGGVGADDITTGAGRDVILGDDGQATFAQGKLVRVTTKNEGVAGDDTIRAGDGANVVLGGSGNDAITTGVGDDVVFGDNGAIDFVNGIRFEALSERAGGGGRDTIVTGAGADLVIGGLGADSIDAGRLDSDADIVFGDNGHVTFDVLGRITLAETMDPTLGGDDIIDAGAG